VKNFEIQVQIVESKSPKIMCTRKWSSSPIKAGKHDLTAESRTPKSPKMIFNAHALGIIFSPSDTHLNAASGKFSAQL